MNALDRVVAGISDRLRSRVLSEGGREIVTREDGTRWLHITGPELAAGEPRVQVWLPAKEPYPDPESGRSP